MKFNFNEIIAKITRTPIRMVYDIIEPKKIWKFIQLFLIKTSSFIKAKLSYILINLKYVGNVMYLLD